jgi:hypothetical protein
MFQHICHLTAIFYSLCASFFALIKFYCRLIAINLLFTFYLEPDYPDLEPDR